MVQAANFLDCRINAYPYVKRWKGWEGINRQVPNLLFIDCDQSRFRDKESLNKSLSKTLQNIKDKLGGNPTVIWSGHGYHIIQPLDAILLEDESQFAKFDQPSRGLLQFGEYQLSDKKADFCHNSTMSLKNCMLRIPGSFNAKGAFIEVKVIQRWNGYRPSIKPLLFDLYIHLQSEKLKRLQRKKQGYHYHPAGEFCKYWRKK